MNIFFVHPLLNKDQTAAVCRLSIELVNELTLLSRPGKKKRREKMRDKSRYLVLAGIK